MSSYLDQSGGDAIAATLPTTLFSAYLAAAPLDRTAALQQASSDVDNACRYQGRRYDTVNQALEFPRVAHEPSTRTIPNTGATATGAGWGETVWDIDPNTNQPIVPAKVLLAVVHQANWILAGGGQRADDQHEGIQDQMMGPARETYRSNAGGVMTGLCRRAWQLMRKYQLASGRLL